MECNCFPIIGTERSNTEYNSVLKRLQWAMDSPYAKVVREAIRSLTPVCLGTNLCRSSRNLTLALLLVFSNFTIYNEKTSCESPTRSVEIANSPLTATIPRQCLSIRSWQY